MRKRGRQIFDEKEFVRGVHTKEENKCYIATCSKLQ